MSEYDAGTLPPKCPDCGEYEPVEWTPCTACNGTGGAWDDPYQRGRWEDCLGCDGDGGHYHCTACEEADAGRQLSLAPSGESGVPKMEDCPECAASGHVVICAAHLDHSTPPVSSPEKPDLMPRSVTDSEYASIHHALSLPMPSSSLPTYEEVESLLDDIVSRIRPVIAVLHRDLEEARKGAELDDPVTDAILAKIETMPEGREHTSAPTRDLRWLAATIRNLRSRLDALYTGLTEVQQERDSYHREASKAWSMADALEAKVKALSPHQSCACSYDRPDDVCSHHSPQLSKALEALETAERERDEARKELAAREAGDREWNRIQNNLDKLTRGGLEQ